MLSVEEIRAMANVDPDFEPIMKSNPLGLGGWTFETDIPKIRAIAAYLRQQKKAQGPDPATLPWAEEDIKIPVRDGTEIIARVHRPQTMPCGGAPVFVLFHGGGFMVGDAESSAWLANIFTELGGVTVNVEYRLAPEHKFPQAAEDAFDALKWVARNAEKLGGDLKRGFLVGGESAGADLANITAHLYVEEKELPLLTGVYSSIPCGVNDEVLPQKYKDKFFSLEQNKSALILSRESVLVVWDRYAVDFKDPMAFPIAFPDHSKLPKTYFQVCGMDPIRDCGLILENEWREAGVMTKMDVYPGLPHGFWIAWAAMPFGQKHREDSRKGLEWLLSSRELNQGGNSLQ